MQLILTPNDVLTSLPVEALVTGSTVDIALSGIADGQQVKVSISASGTSVFQGLLASSIFTGLTGSLSLDTQPLKTYTQYKDSVTGTLKVEVGNNVLVQADVQILNQGFSGSPEGVDQYYTKSQVDALIADVVAQDVISDNANDAALATEVSARTSADTALGSRIDTEASTRTSADTALRSDLEDEADTRANSFSTLSSAISDEGSRAVAVEGTLSSAISAEVSRATSAESSLSSAISAEVTRAESTESTLSTAITAETSRATTAENSLSTRIDGKADSTHTHAISDVTGLQSALNDIASNSALTEETSARTSADTALGSRIDTEASDRASADTALSSRVGVLETDCYSGSVATPAISSGVLTLDLVGGKVEVFTVALNAAITSIVIQNIPSTRACVFNLRLVADGTARAVTWGSAIKWAGGTAPTLTSTNTKVDSFVFITVDSGTSWIGSTQGQNY